MVNKLSDSKSETARCSVNAGQRGPVQQKLPYCSIKSRTVFDFVGFLPHFEDLEEAFDPLRLLWIYL
jgi:hypothetical protein